MELFDIIFLFIGAACLCYTIRARISGDVSHLKVFLPTNVKPEECKDPAGFIRSMFPWLLALSIALVVTGVLCVAGNQGVPISTFANIVCLVVTFALLISMIVVEKKLVKKFW